MKSMFNATCNTNVVGDGTVGQMVSWLEKFVNVLFPENAIEYFADNQYGRGRCLTRDERVPGAGLTDDDVHHVACYVREGSNEGRVIEVCLCLRSEVFKSLTWIKTFGSADECWLIARAIDAALTSIIFWSEVPELVTMADKLPRASWWNRVTSLQDEITIRSSPDSVLVSTDTGLVLDSRSWTTQQTFAGSNVKAVVKDWITILTNTKAQFKVVEDQEQRIVVEDLPGYVFSNRGVEGVTGFYVLPPGGRRLFDCDYIGYFPDADAAIAAARHHKSSLLPIAA